MISSVRPSVTGVKAAAAALSAVASNVANVRNTGKLADAQVSAVPPAPSAGGQGDDDTLYRPVRADNVTVAGGGVRAIVRHVDPAHVAAFDPGDPNADEDGLVARPKVDLADQMVRMRQARHLYSANLKLIETADEMSTYLLDRKA